MINVFACKSVLLFCVYSLLVPYPKTTSGQYAVNTFCLNCSDHFEMLFDEYVLSKIDRCFLNENMAQK